MAYPHPLISQHLGGGPERMSQVKNKQAARSIADSLGLSHFVIANAIVFIGQVTNLFSFMGTKNPGIDFVKVYIAAPAVPLLTWLLIVLEAVTDNVVKAAFYLTGTLSDNRLQQVTKSGFSFVDDFYKDESYFGLFLSTEAIILSASVLYWIVCYLSVRTILLITD